MNIFRPSIVTLQETKAPRKECVKLKGYCIFETLRPLNNGGGLLTAIDSRLDPAIVSGDDKSNKEILTVQIKVGKYKIRVINSYGPQECDDAYEIFEFWESIEQEIIAARDENCLIIMELDANAKLGYKKISKDPHSMSSNGSIFWDFINRHNLTIVNTMELCTGTITRTRNTVLGLEASVLDYVVVCDTLKEHLDFMLVDEEQNFSLTNYHGRKKIKSDHNIVYCRFFLDAYDSAKPIRKEIYKLKDQRSQEAFYNLTNTTNTLSESFSLGYSFPHMANVFYKRLKSSVYCCFKKVRIIKGGKPRKIVNAVQVILETKRNYELFLSRCSCLTLRERATTDLKKIEVHLTEMMARRNTKLIRNHVNSIVTDGNFSQIKLWKLKRKLCPPVSDVPMAKRDESGTLVTSPKLLKALYARTYKHRLRSREIKPHLHDIYLLKSELWDLKMRELTEKKSTDWSLLDIRNSIKTLKNNKAADPDGFVNELLKEGCAGIDLELALVSLFNGIKKTFHLPEYMIKQNITTIFKNKLCVRHLRNT